MAAFTHYWSLASNDVEAAAAVSTPLDHTADSRFGRCRVGVGDTVYIITARKGCLHLIGKMKVGEVIHDDAEATARLGYKAWEAADHLIASHCTPVRLTELSDDVVAQLRFVTSKGSTPLKFVEPGRLDRQTARGVRRLEPESAALLDLYLPEMDEFSPTKPSYWRTKSVI